MIYCNIQIVIYMYGSKHNILGSSLQLEFILLIYYYLTTHNWQKWKSTFLTCPCHKIYSEQAVGLESSNYTLKITIFMNMWNFGQFCEIWYFVRNCLIKVWILKSFWTYVTHIIVNTLYMLYTFRFYSIDFQLNTDFPSQFSIFYPKITQPYSKIGFSRKCF